ncbi:ABC transporter permease [Metamycoplasma neophronis]|uniref:ABC transporter permease n=1 Tax=Metamycoplasma neophronis TaxID=872983 RepID=A0ABY2Z4G7_9BACT|nr:ABC transporter permease [Metamycoplasma neophronis]TPR53269.1 ABC transporter permease [Metamycoplasma neophronis]
MAQVSEADVKSFNKQYKINDELAQKFSFITDKEKQRTSSIAGKPKKMGIEIIKRFFKNPVVVISLAVFILLLLMSILIPNRSFTSYTPNRQIYDSSFANSLPPYSNPFVTVPIDTNSEVWKKLNYITSKMNENEDYKNLMLYAFNPKVDFDYSFIPGTNLIRIKYNTYALIYADLLNTYIVENTVTTTANGTTSATINLTTQQVIEFVSKWRNYFKNVLVGTSSTGYDIWVTVWYSTWRAIKIALIVVALQGIIGISIGAYLGFNAGKLVDTIFMRAIEIFLAPPTLIWILLFVSVLGANESALILALTIVGWPGFVGLTRMFVITVKNEEYITAAKAIGASASRQIFVHALPAIIGKIATSLVKSVPGTILWIASLAFLGFFKEQNDTNLGQILIQASSETGSNPWILLLPALILLLLSLSLNFIALGIHDALDPKVMSKGKRK